jgi:hypothetical protein
MQLYVFKILVENRYNLPVSFSCRFNTGERLCDTHWVRGWVSPGDLKAVEAETSLPELNQAII